MAPSAMHPAHNKLLAQVRQIRQRVENMEGQIRELDDQHRTALIEQTGGLAERCEELEVEIASWEEVEIGIPTSLEDLESAVDTLEADVEALVSADTPGAQLALDRQVKAWKRRVDWLRLQGALGTMQARDELDELSQRLGRVRGDVLVELQNALEDSKAVVVDLRKDVQAVLTDVRHAVEKAAADMTTRS